MTDQNDALDTNNTDSDTQQVADNQSAVFVGRWRGLVSQTNWEKGRVIAEWRQSLVEGGAETSEYSDEAWSRRVGGITPQHVGRLRRVHEKFGDGRQGFEDLFWSHFHATIDWEDAEMWLEGAVQNDWSVSQMRRQRWETLGGEEADEPTDSEIVATEENEDIDLAETEPLPDRVDARIETVEGFNKEERADGMEPDESNAIGVATADAEDDDEFPEGEPTLPPVRPFEDLPELPDDLADAFDDMKLSILRHKTNDWEEIPLNDVLMSLDALKQLAGAPA